MFTDYRKSKSNIFNNTFSNITALLLTTHATCVNPDPPPSQIKLLCHVSISDNFCCASSFYHFLESVVHAVVHSWMQAYISCLQSQFSLMLLKKCLFIRLQSKSMFEQTEGRMALSTFLFQKQSGKKIINPVISIIIINCNFGSLADGLLHPSIYTAYYN